MKNILYTSLLFFIGLSFTSCSSSVDFTVNGRPGTVIYSPTNQQLATIDHNGKAKVKVNRDKFYPYLLSKSSNSEEPIPFALNFKGNSSFLHHVAFYTGAAVGTAGAAVGTVGLCEGPDDGRDLALAGFGTMIVGWIPAAFVGTYLETNADVHHEFKYEKQQYTNEDLYLDLSPKYNRNYQDNPKDRNNQNPSGEKKKKQTRKDTNNTQAKDDEAFIHTAKQGETLKSIAEMYDVSVKDLIKWNKKKKNSVKAGEKIKIYY